MFSRQTAENAYLGDVAAGELLADNHLALEARVAAAEVARTALGRGQADVARLRAKRAVGARLARRLGTHVLERKKEIRFRLRKPKEAKRQRKETKRKRYLEIVASAGGRAEAAEIAVLALVALAHAHAVKARRIAVGRLKQHCQPILNSTAAAAAVERATFLHSSAEPQSLAAKSHGQPTSP